MTLKLSLSSVMIPPSVSCGGTGRGPSVEAERERGLERVAGKTREMRR